LLAKSNRQNTIDRAASQQFGSTMADPTIIILGSPSTDASPYPAAIAFAIFSLLTSLLITPTCIWHTRHRNVGATTVTVLAILANLMNFANALIWPHDDVSRWFSGVGYCDIQVKLQAVMQTAFPAALFCILRKLAAVLDTRKTAWATNATREQREFVIDLLICGALPWLQVISAFIVQPLRFFVSGIAGCQPVDDGTWLSALLLLAPKVLWTTACVYFSGKAAGACLGSFNCLMLIVLLSSDRDSIDRLSSRRRVDVDTP
jgi:pheromone a factor receptor